MKSLIISHWDTDGIVSSSLILNTLEGECDLHISPIGTFTIPEDKIEEFNSANYDQIFIIDYALQKEIVEKLNAGKITMIDHHFTGKASNTEYFNKVIDGASPDDYPCCVMSVIDYVNKVKGESGKGQGEESGEESKIDFLLESSVAAVGDKEHKILKNERFKKRLIELGNGNSEFGNKVKLYKSPSPSLPHQGGGETSQNLEDTFVLLMKMKELIDSNYMSGNLDGAKQTIRDLAKNGVLSVLEDENLAAQVEGVKKEKEVLLTTEPEKLTDNIWFYELKTQYQLLSAVTRGLSKAHPDKIIVTRLGINVYIRRDEFDIDLKDLIDLGQPKGWDIGGKHEVAGIAGCSDEAFTEAVEWLKKNS